MRPVVNHHGLRKAPTVSYSLDDLLHGLRHSRRFFLRHLDGLTDAQWDWKPYAECKSIRETVAHLVVDDRCALQSLESGHEPDYEGMQATETDRDRLLEMLSTSHQDLLRFIAVRYTGAPLDAPACLFGSPRKLADIGFLSSEDYYHAGQVAFIRMATDPTWDYYTAIYGTK